MSLKRKSFVVLVICLASFHVFAQTSSLCSDSFQRICKDTEAEKKADEISHFKLIDEITTEANINAAPKLLEAKNSITEAEVNKRAVALFKAKYHELIKSTKARLGDFESVISSVDNANKIKEYMYLIINKNNFDIKMKAKLKETVRGITVKTFTDFIEEPGRTNNFLGKFVRNCGPTGFRPGAFAAFTPEGEKYVIVCPTFSILLRKVSTEQERFNTVIHVIAHEMAHHLDNSEVGVEIYNPYLKCVADNYADKLSINITGKKCRANSVPCKTNITLKHAGELIADQWAAEVVALHLKTEHSSYFDAETLIVDSMTNLCKSKDEGIHPDGAFRIESIIKTNTNINEALGCTETKTKPSCTFAGAN
jgi:hypothetical protein